MASTYTDLGVELMATGENAGTWGTKTNTNLNLIEQISGGYAIQTLNAAGTGANTTTLAKADGALDATVASRVIILGAVSPQAITGNKIVTMPVLTENFYIIKNSTSGAYTVQLKAASGSGATVTWSTTDKGWKIVYFDGVATNTGVYDVNSNLSDITVNDLTVNGNLDVDGGTIKLDGNYPTGTGNVALGDTALDDGSLSGASNTAIGSAALTANTSGTNNAAVGTLALAANTTGADNTAVGVCALNANTTGYSNTAVGKSALAANITYTCNTAVGFESLTSNTSAANSTAVGYKSLKFNTTGAENVAVGATALDANTIGCRGVAIGYNAMGANTDGNYNTAVGRSALATNTTGDNNVSIGYSSLQNSTTAGDNVAVGMESMFLNTTGVNNTALGICSLRANTTGADNTAVGVCALNANTTGCCNTAVGPNAGIALTTGIANTFVGSRTGCTVTTGARNVMIGEVAGTWSTNALTTGQDNTYIGYAIQPSSVSVGCELVINAKGNGTTAKGSGTGFIDPNGGGVYQGNNTSTWSTTSDRRIKKNIVDNTIGLDKINQIQVRNFEYRTPDEITELPKHSAINKQGVQVGVIAQEIEEILPDVVKEESTGVKSVNPDNLTWYMINAIKELKARIETLENK